MNFFTLFKDFKNYPPEIVAISNFLIDSWTSQNYFGSLSSSFENLNKERRRQVMFLSILLESYVAVLVLTSEKIEVSPFHELISKKLHKEFKGLPTENPEETQEFLKEAHLTFDKERVKKSKNPLFSVSKRAVNSFFANLSEKEELSLTTKLTASTTILGRSLKNIIQKLKQIK